MGSVFPFFFKKQINESPNMTPYSSAGFHRHKSKPHFQNKKNSYIDLNNKYQLSNQRWTTIRQYEKLSKMVMRNFSKSIERGKNNHKNTTTAYALSYFENNNSDSANRRIDEYEQKKYDETTNFENKKLCNSHENSSHNHDKISEFLDNSKQLLIKNDELFEDLEQNKRTDDKNLTLNPYPAFENNLEDQNYDEFQK